MTSLMPARRSAERFDALVEATGQGARPDPADHRTAELLELVGALRSVPEADARPEFVSDLRERLMTAAATELVAAPRPARDEVARLTVKPIRTRRERRIGVALGAAAILGATTSMAVASQSAIPGDALYPVKRAIENTQAGISFGDDAKGHAILGNASARLDEVDQLTQADQPDAQLVTQTLNTFADQATDASDHLLSDYAQTGHQGSIAQLHQFADQSMAELSDLADVVPEGAHDALLGAAQTLFSIDASATSICPDPACGEGITSVPAQLVAGAATALDEAANPQAAGELAGTGGAAQDQQAQGGKGHGQQPSGLSPPETPIQLPTQPSAAPTGLDSVLPSPTGTTGGVDINDSTGHGGKGGKHKHPVDLAPVTDAVNEVVTGVVEGVNGLLNGLTGDGALTGTTTGTVPGS